MSGEQFNLPIRDVRLTGDDPESLEEVKGLLGHSGVTITERYAHLADSAPPSRRGGDPP